MKYVGRVFRPPSEADSLILQATIGCSWNHCTYCAMYQDKAFRIRPLPEIEADIWDARQSHGGSVRRVFIADGDALAMPTHQLLSLLRTLREAFPKLQRISCYATAINLEEKSVAELSELRGLGLRLLYLGPESGDDRVLKQIAKGSSAKSHVDGARKCAEAGVDISAIFLLGVAGQALSEAHAQGSARLATEMNPKYVSLLTVTVIEGTPLAQLQKRERYTLPTTQMILKEARLFVDQASPRNAVFRSNHPSNYLALAGRLPRDRVRLLRELDAALDGQSPLRGEWQRGL